VWIVVEGFKKEEKSLKDECELARSFALENELF
jgi:hypothetical protein